MSILIWSGCWDLKEATSIYCNDNFKSTECWMERYPENQSEKMLHQASPFHQNNQLFVWPPHALMHAWQCWSMDQSEVQRRDLSSPPNHSRLTHHQTGRVEWCYRHSPWLLQALSHLSNVFMVNLLSSVKSILYQWWTCLFWYFMVNASRAPLCHAVDIGPTVDGGPLGHPDEVCFWLFGQRHSH